MTLAERNARRIVVGAREYRWKLQAQREPEFGFVAELPGDVGARLIVEVGLGYLVAPRIVAGCIEAALERGWLASEVAMRMKCPTELLGEQRRWQCPCCDYFSLPVRGQYDICPICGWEDDGLDLDRPDEASGPNHATLREARAVFEQTGGNVDVSHYERRPRRVGAAKPC